MLRFVLLLSAASVISTLNYSPASAQIMCGDGMCDYVSGECEVPDCMGDCAGAVDGAGDPLCCGDRVCERWLGEDTMNCPMDCTTPSPCGDGICASGEGECSSCRMDCETTTVCCGNRNCEAWESTATCEMDCPRMTPDASIDAPIPDATIPDAAPPSDCSMNSDCDDESTCTEDRCEMGSCVYDPSAAVGDACDDGRYCTTDDTCDADGFCTGLDTCTTACAATSTFCNEETMMCSPARIIDFNGCECDNTMIPDEVTAGLDFGPFGIPPITCGPLGGQVEAQVQFSAGVRYRAPTCSDLGESGRPQCRGEKEASFSFGREREASESAGAIELCGNRLDISGEVLIGEYNQHARGCTDDCVRNCIEDQYCQDRDASGTIQASLEKDFFNVKIPTVRARIPGAGVISVNAECGLKGRITADGTLQARNRENVDFRDTPTSYTGGLDCTDCQNLQFTMGIEGRLTLGCYASINLLSKWQRFSEEIGCRECGTAGLGFYAGIEDSRGSDDTASCPDNTCLMGGATFDAGVNIGISAGWGWFRGGARCRATYIWCWEIARCSGDPSCSQRFCRRFDAAGNPARPRGVPDDPTRGGGTCMHSEFDLVCTACAGTSCNTGRPGRSR